MKSWTDYETTEEAFEALRIMRGGEPTADELADKAGIEWAKKPRRTSDADLWDAKHMTALGMRGFATIFIYKYHREPSLFLDYNRATKSELEAILAKMREVQGG